MHFNRSDWFPQSRLSAHIPLFDLVWRVIAVSPSDKMAEKSRFCELSTDIIQEMLENAIPIAF